MANKERNLGLGLGFWLGMAVMSLITIGGAVFVLYSQFQQIRYSLVMIVISIIMVTIGIVLWKRANKGRK